MDWRTHITVDPQVCHGKACFRGTRILVSAILDNLAAGTATDQLLSNFPSLTRESIHAAIAYAADLARERALSIRASPGS